MEAVGSYEMLINASNITWCINPEDKYLNLYGHENLKSHIREHYMKYIRRGGHIRYHRITAFVKVIEVFKKYLLSEPLQISDNLLQNCLSDVYRCGSL
jgi:hypothetical protein